MATSSSSSFQHQPTKNVCVFLLNQTGELLVVIKNDTHNKVTGVLIPLPPSSPVLKSLTALDITSILRPELRRISRLFKLHILQQNGYLKHKPCDDVFNEFFSLYIVSPHLELQLLPNHQPFKILSCWNSMLSKYTYLKKDKIVTDQPILSYQRNIFLKRHEESIVEDVHVLELLYEEAKVNILSGRYPLDDYEIMASIQAAIELGPYNSKLHVPSYFKLKDYEFLPLHYRMKLKQYSKTNSKLYKVFPQSSKIMFRRGSRSVSPPPTKSAPYFRIVDLFRLIHEHRVPSRIELIRSYLSHCWSLPFYGSAYFLGQIEKVTTGMKLLLPHYDKPIWVAVNWEGLHIIDKKTCKHLLSLNYDEFKWQIGHPHHASLDQNMEPKNHLIQCLFIQINVKDANESSMSGKECKVFQIFSKSSPLVASLIRHFSSQSPNRDVPDSGSFREDLVTNTKPLDKSCLKPLERICCATFNAKGECIKYQGSIKVLT